MFTSIVYFALSVLFATLVFKFGSVVLNSMMPINLIGAFFGFGTFIMFFGWIGGIFWMFDSVPGNHETLAYGWLYGIVLTSFVYAVEAVTKKLVKIVEHRFAKSS
jgi:hypothetical protein